MSDYRRNLGNLLIPLAKVGDATNMVRLRNKQSEGLDQEQRPATGPRGTPPRPLDERLIPSVPPPGAPYADHRPDVLCGYCHQVINDPSPGRTTMCEHCGRKLGVPSYVSTRCQRCGHRHRIRFRELATERVCANCGWTLAVGTIILTQRQHHRNTLRHVRHRQTSAHADAAWAVLIVGLTLVIAVLALTVL